MSPLCKGRILPVVRPLHRTCSGGLSQAVGTEATGTKKAQNQPVTPAIRVLACLSRRSSQYSTTGSRSCFGLIVLFLPLFPIWFARFVEIKAGLIILLLILARHVRRLLLPLNGFVKIARLGVGGGESVKCPVLLPVR